MKIYKFTKYQVSYKGAAGKAFSAHMPACKLNEMLLKVKNI
jgi:hypothetical protein